MWINRRLACNIWNVKSLISCFANQAIIICKGCILAILDLWIYPTTLISDKLANIIIYPLPIAIDCKLIWMPSLRALPWKRLWNTYYRTAYLNNPIRKCRDIMTCIRFTSNNEIKMLILWELSQKFLQKHEPNLLVSPTKSENSHTCLAQFASRL